MAIHAEQSQPQGLGGNRVTDPRIIPDAERIELMSRFLTPDLGVIVNHAHGVLGGFVQGPEEVSTVIGLKTLREMEAFEEQVQEEILEDAHGRVPAATSEFIHAIDLRRQELRTGLSAQLSDMRFEGREVEIVPTILKAYAFDLAPTVGVVEDLSEIEKARAILGHAIRKGVSSDIRSALEIHLDQLIKSQHLQGKALEVDVATGDLDSATGELTGLHRDREAGISLEVALTEGGRRRIARDKVTSIGAIVTNPPTTKNSTRRRFF